jgi:hypothetical protein
MTEPPPLRPTDDEARTIARRLLEEATHASLAFRDPATGAPNISRIALALAPDWRPMTLLSNLSAHTKALTADPSAALLVGEPGAKGDPLTYPRLSLIAEARFVPRDTPEHMSLRAHYLKLRPKAGLYADFADFRFALFEPKGASLNGGFGKAYALAPADLGA